MTRTPNGYLTACPFCSEDTLYDGKRRYWPEGFPYVHACMVKTLPLNETPVKRDVAIVPKQGGIDL